MKSKQSVTPGDKTICLPIAEGIDYEALVEDRKAFRRYLDRMIWRYPELFPDEIGQGYSLHGFKRSIKQQLTTRRIRLKANREAYQIRPDFVMPYMIGKVEEVEKGLYLRRYGVPFEGVAYVLGHDPMYWYRATLALGRPSVVGSTVKFDCLLPPSPVGG